MGYFTVRYDSRVVIYERNMFIRLANDYYWLLGSLSEFVNSYLSFESSETKWLDYF